MEAALTRLPGNDDPGKETRPRRRFLVATFTMIVAMSSASVVNVVYVTYLARSLDKAALGIFFCAQSLLLVAAAPGGALQTFLAGVYACVGAGRGAEVFRLWGKILGLAGLIFAGLFAVTSPFFAPILRFDSPLPFVATGVALCFYAPLPLLYGRLQGRQNFRGLGAVYFAEAAVRPGAVLLLGAFALLDSTGAVASISVGFLAAAGLALILGRTGRPSPSEPAAGKEPSTSGLAYTVASLLALSAFSYMDVLFAQHFLGTVPEGPGSLFGGSGAYGAAAFIGRAFVMVTFPLVMVMFPKVARAHRASESGGIFLRDTALMTFFMWALGWGVCALFPAAISKALFPGYPETAALLKWFPLAILPIMILTILTYYNLARRRFKIAAILPAGVVLQWGGYSLFHGSTLEILTVLGVTGGILALGVVAFSVFAGRPAKG
ncbi:MAG: lipopolysaccharide biosynthesis protein [Planctomycetota bacterium]|jgi:O-antigen/teichoic acid export membrane protein